MKRGVRKPRTMKSKIFPLVQVEDGKVWMQATPAGKWVKVPPGRALWISDRLKRAANFAMSERARA